MSWLDRLQKAQYRGVSFLTESHEAKYGNRLVVHEFPGGDTPVVEDMGVKAQEWSVNAYFIGADYDQARDRFLYALITKGPSELIHPWLGKMTVWPRTWSVSESTDQGGYCRVSVEFVPGNKKFEQAKVDQTDVAVDAIDSLQSKMASVFKLVSMASGELTSFIASAQSGLDGLRSIISIATLPLTWADQLFRLVDGTKAELSELLDLPGAYANRFRHIANLLGAGEADSGLEDVIAVISLANSSTTTDVALVPDYDRPRLVRLFTKAVPEFSAAERLLTKQAAPVNTIFNLPFNVAKDKLLRAVLLVSAAAELALVEYQTSADRDAAVDSVALAIDALLPVLPDELFNEMWAVRTTVIDALRAQVLGDVIVKRLVNPMPAVVLAYRLQMDEAAFLAANKVRHPLFVVGDVVGY